jgi:PEGA domain
MGYDFPLMNRAMLVAGAVVAVLLFGLIMLRDRPDPEPPVNTSAPAPAPRVVRKRPDSAPSPAAAPKTASKKAEPKSGVEKPAPTAETVASLRLESDVPGASVFIDRQFVGNTPLTLDNIEPGAKRVQLTATGFDSIQRTIEVKPGPNTILLRIKEVSLSARAAVVHKHGIGSCEGTLRATLDGLQYVTTNKGDAFMLPYSQLETFAVDYLDKNLRVKQRGGKTWNFTDRAENADNLFVFHRDVESARKKLAAGYSPAQ